MREIGQREIDELITAGERQGRLGALAGQDVHTRAFAARLDDGQEAGRPGSGDDVEAWHGI